jgi:hypothetical protein
MSVTSITPYVSQCIFGRQLDKMHLRLWNCYCRTYVPLNRNNIKKHWPRLGLLRVGEGHEKLGQGKGNKIMVLRVVPLKSRSRGMYDAILFLNDKSLLDAVDGAFDRMLSEGTDTIRTDLGLVKLLIKPRTKGMRASDYVGDA